MNKRKFFSNDVDENNKENRYPAGEIINFEISKKTKIDVNETDPDDTINQQNCVLINLDILSPIEPTICQGDSNHVEDDEMGSSMRSKDTNTEDVLMNALDQTTQLRSSNASGCTTANSILSSPLDENLRLMDTCLKLVKLPTQTKYVEDPASELPALVGLECARTGSVYLPFGGDQAERLIDAYSYHHLRSSSTTSHTFIGADEVNFKNPVWNERLKMLVQRISNMFECKIPVQARLEKLIALQKGDRVNISELRRNKSMSFGTLLIELPSNYTGGEIIAYDEVNMTRINTQTDFRRKERLNEFALCVTALSTDIDFEIDTLESGHRLIVVYSLDWSLDDCNIMSANKNGGEQQQPRSLEGALSEALNYFSKEAFPIAIMLREDYEGEMIEKMGVLAFKSVDLDRFNLLMRVNESLSSKPFNFYICRAELTVEWHDRKGWQPWDDPMSACSHEWEEKSRSTSIISWHSLSGARVFNHLEVPLSHFSAVLNPNSNARRFWERPDQCDDAWGNLDESEHEMISEHTLSRTVFYHRWFLAFWSREHEFDMVLERDYKQALDIIIEQTATNTQPDGESQQNDRNFDASNKTIETTTMRLRQVFELLDNQKLQLDATYVNPILRMLTSLDQLDLLLKFIKQSSTVLAQNLPDYDLIAKLIVKYGLEKLNTEGLSLFLKPVANQLSLHLKISEELVNLSSKSLAQDYFRAYILPIFKSNGEFERVVHQNRALSKIRVIGREQPMDARRLRPGDSELIQCARLIGLFGFDECDDNEEFMLGFTLAVRQGLESSSLKILLEDIANEWDLFKRSRRIRELFKLEWIAEKCRKDSEFTWRMSQARMTEYPQVEDFLRSDEVRMVLTGVFNGIQQARRFALQHNGLKNGYSTKMIESGSGRGAQVEIIKTSEYFENKRANLKKYEAEQDRIMKLIIK